jgi:hypothetical protein
MNIWLVNKETSSCKIRSVKLDNKNCKKNNNIIVKMDTVQMLRIELLITLTLFLLTLLILLNRLKRLKNKYSANMKEVDDLAIKVTSGNSLINESYRDLIQLKTKFDQLVNKYSQQKIKVVKMPKELRTAFQQYLLFFREYVLCSKGKEISFDVSICDEGLEIIFKEESNNGFKIIEDYMNEYLDFARRNKVGIINVENNPDPKSIDILRLRLEQQLSNLNVELKFSVLRGNLLEEKVKGLEDDKAKLLTTINEGFLSLVKNERKYKNPKSIDPIDLKDDCKSKIANDKLDEVFSILKTYLGPIHSEKRNEVIIIEQQWRIIRREKMVHQINTETYLRGISKISDSLLKLIDET